MKNNKLRIILLYSLIITLTYFFTSCAASVSLTSWKDPNFKGPAFSRVLVMAVIKDLTVKKAFETEAVNSLKDAGIPAITSMSIMAPNTKYTNQELDDLFKNNNVDGLLILRYKGTKVTEIYHPGISYYQYYYDAYGLMGAPGYIEKHKTVLVQCSLFSISTGKAVWVADTKTQNYRSLDNLSSSLGDKITDDLKQEGIIK
jgi:hypothetical protein